MEPLNLSSSLMITYPSKTLELMCPPRSTWKALRSLFVELQSYWVEYGFSTADLIADDGCWERMQAIAQLFPRKDNPAVTGFDLEPLQTDPTQLEQLFLTQDRTDIYAYKVDDKLLINFFIDTFKGCKILEFCRFEPRLVIQDGHALWLERQQAAEPEIAEVEAAPEPQEKPTEVAEINPAAKRRKAS